MAKKDKNLVISVLSHDVEVLQDMEQNALQSWGYMNHGGDEMRIANDISDARRARVLLHQVFEYINMALEIGFDNTGVKAISVGWWSIMMENGIFANDLIKMVGGKSMAMVEPENARIRVLSIDYDVNVIDGGPKDIQAYGHLRYGGGVITLATELSYQQRVSTFIHELMHIVLIDLGQDISEQQMVAFEHGFFSFLSDNKLDLAQFDWWILHPDEYD